MLSRNRRRRCEDLVLLEEAFRKPRSPSIVVTKLAGVADSCLAASAQANAADTVSLAFVFDTNQMPAPGTYAMVGAWQATLRRSDSACATLTEESAVQGVLSIDSVDRTVRGTADVTFPSGRLIATFNAPSCAAPNGNASTCTVYPACPPTTAAWFALGGGRSRHDAGDGRNFSR